MKKFKWAGVAILFLIGGACSTSRITSTWRTQDAIIPKYSKIMVLGLILDSDRSLQEKMETHMANDLRNLGYTAVTSLQQYGPKAFDKMDEAAAIKSLRGSGIDAVITIVLLDKEKERRYVPGNIYYSPYSTYYNRFWGYRGTLYQRIYEPGYYVTDTKYFWESNLYDMATQKLIYSVQTQSFDPSNSEELGHEYGELIVKNMVKENILNQSPAKAF